ncbi:acyl-CoA thioesterase [Falsihalocynthiibacter sp. BN13B15]|uniref:acyl-CoA thioesterase n=1 Tax=Falsihalocynthiibacter sp. BN13B15 TaxID=3240871 RepID=UPI00350FEF18
MNDVVQRPTTPATLITVAPYNEATPSGAIFGGWIMSQLDHTAGLAGRKISNGNVVIASIKELNFHAALAAGEEFAVYAELSRRGNSSFNLAISGWAEPEAACRRIMTADVLLVAVDAEGKSRKLPDA